MAADRRTKEELRRLELMSARIGDPADEKSTSARARGYRMLNREFHGLIHAMTGTEVVRWLCGSLMDRADFYINSSTDVSPLGSALAERHADHQAIVAGIAERDPATARAAAERHIVVTVDLIKKELRKELRTTSRPGG
jgi:DNA-binding GntR family transcriptional regulator